MANGGSGVPLMPSMESNTWDIIKNATWSDGGWLIDEEVHRLHAMYRDCGEVEWKLRVESPTGIPAANMTSAHWDLISGGSHANNCAIIKNSTAYGIQFRDGDTAYVVEG